jgi:mycothiol synthase
VRDFVPGADDGAWLALNSVAFAGHPEQGSLSAVDLSRRLAQPWFRPGDIQMAEPRNGVGWERGEGAASSGGYIWVKVDPPDGGTGEIYAVAVHPDAQGRGLGRVLVEAGLDRLERRGVSEAVLYGEGDNAAALGLYRRLGFEVAAVHAQYGWG